MNTARSLFAIIVSIVCLAAASDAQSHRIAEASIPFDFQVGAKTLAAGRYSFARLPSTSDTTTLIVRDSGDRVVASTFLTFDKFQRGRLGKLPVLVFSTNGTSKTLAFLSDPGADYLGRTGKPNPGPKSRLPKDSGAVIVSLKPVPAGR